MRIFLTGAGGFLGSHLLTRLLADSHAVAVLVRPENRAEARNLQALGMPVIEYRNALDSASLTLIEEVLNDIREAKTGQFPDSLEDQASWTRARRA